MSTRGYRFLCWLRVHTKIMFEYTCQEDDPCSQDDPPCSKEDLSASIEKWQTALDHYWNNEGKGWRIGTSRVRYTFELREYDEASSDGWHHIRVKCLKWPDRSWCTYGPASGCGIWDKTANPMVAAHETGHLMGIPHREDGPDEEKHPGITTECVMVRVNEDVFVPEAHVKEVMDLVGLTGARGCCAFLPWMPWQPLKPVDSGAPAIVEECKDFEALSAEVALQAINAAIPWTLWRAVHVILERGEARLGDLLDMAEEGTDLQRIAMAIALQRLGRADQETIPKLKAMLETDNVALRLHAAYALALRGEKEGRKVLTEAQEDDRRIDLHLPRTASSLAKEMLQRLNARSAK